MASSSNPSLFIFLILAISSLQLIAVHARDAKLFSKFVRTTETAQNDPFDQTTTTATAAASEVQPVDDLAKLYPQGQNGYGLYGRVPEKTSFSSINSEPVLHDENYYNGNVRTVRQGMSDTRFMENGKYFYDVNSDKYSTGRATYFGDDKSDKVPVGNFGVDDKSEKVPTGYFGENMKLDKVPTMDGANAYDGTWEKNPSVFNEGNFQNAKVDPYFDP